MKYLLITTVGKNPGDEFIRIGLRKLISENDANAEFTLVDKEDESTWCPFKNYDKIVLCGMPYLWSNCNGSTLDAPWYRYVVEAAIDEGRPRDFAALGIGCFFGTDGIKDHMAVAKAFRDLRKGYATATFRDLHMPFMGLSGHALPCPSVFAVKNLKKTLKLVNIMPTGTHYDILCREQSQLFIEHVRPMLLDIGSQSEWLFVCHSKHERDFLLSSGIHECKALYSDSPFDYLGWYSAASDVISCRVHGAIVGAASGSRTVGICMDSRLTAGTLAGANMVMPSAVASKDDLLSMLTESRFNNQCYEQYTGIIRRFLRI